MAHPLRALIVEDSEADCALLARMLRHGGYDLHHRRVDSVQELRANLDTESWDIVISDYSIPGFSGAAALEIVRAKDPDLPFIFVSGTIGEERAVQAMKVGAQDYIMKGNLARLLPAIGRELREAEGRRERRRVEQHMRQLEKFEVIGRLAGGVAHDFNNVIGAILVWAELGREAVPPGSNISDYFQKIRAQAERAAGLTRQLLAYARRQILEPRNIDLNDTVREAVGLLGKALGEQIDMQVVLASDLPVTRADAVRLEQVLMNLCFNARDAMPRGGRLLIETRSIEVDPSYCAMHPDARPGRYVLLTVSDNGVGMDAATQNHIFEPFFTTKEPGKGTGLGLATVLGIVKQHEGWIEVSSDAGKGSDFRVFLPASAGRAEPRAAAAEGPVQGGSETILVAEDDAAIRETVEVMLTRLGYRVMLARDGEEAVQRYKEHRNDIALILLDVAMPGLSGADAYARIDSIKPGVPVIFTSGHPDEPVLETSTPGKFVAVLQKPYGPKVLSRVVRELLDRARNEAARAAGE